MFPAHTGRRTLLLACALFVAFAVALPAAAQSTGMVKGTVVDLKGQPIEGAKVTIEYKDGGGRVYTVKTNKKGEYSQIGLTPGNYTVTADKDKVGSQSFDCRVRLGEAAEVKFQLGAGASGPSKEDLAKVEAVKKLFAEGVTASRSGDNDAAIAKFSDAAALLPTCSDCYYNIGYAQTQKKDYPKAEEAFKKAIEMKPDYVEAYNGLATVYNAQKKFTEAEEASQKAASLAAAGGGPTGGGSVDALYNQGVISWNAGKADDAKKSFEEAIKLDPNYPNAHYQLGMCYLNLGKMPEAVAEFESYLHLAPDGQYAAQAKAMVAQLKK